MRPFYGVFKSGLGLIGACQLRYAADEVCPELVAMTDRDRRFQADLTETLRSTTWLLHRLLTIQEND